VRIVFYNLVPVEYGGGGEFTLTARARSLREDGNEVEYVSDRDYSGRTVLTKEQAASLIGEIPYRHEPFITLPPPFLRPFFRKVPNPRRMDPKALNLLTIDRLPPPWYLRLVRERGITVLFMLHGFSFEPTYKTHPLIRALQAQTRLNLPLFVHEFNRGSFYLQALTDSTRDVLVAAGANPERVFVVGSSVPVDECPVPRPSETFRLLYMGRIEPIMKGAGLLLEIARRVSRLGRPDLRFSIIGEGPASKWFKEFKPGSPVEYLGFIRPPRKLALMESSNILLVTSYMEPFSRVVNESLASGTFVISTPCSGPSSMIGKNQLLGKIVDPDADSFVEEILAQYSRWKQNPTEYFSERLSRCEAARRTHVDSEQEFRQLVTRIWKLGPARDASQIAPD
jgi:glycosyltransferase involved in cell wall biosynthesis